MSLRVILLVDSIVLFGRERGNVDVMVRLAEAGHQVSVVVHKFWARQQLTPHLDRLGLPWHEVDFHNRLGRHSSPWQWLKAMLVISKASWQLWSLVRRERPDVLHICGPRSMLNFLPFFLLTAIPVVVRCGDLPDDPSFLERMLWRVALKRASRVVAISRFVADHLVRLGCREEKVQVILSRAFERRQGDVKVAWAWDDVPVRFCFVGQIAPHKGVGQLLEAANKLHQEGGQFQLILVGAGNDYLDQCLAKCEATLPVFVTGYVDHVAALLACVDILVCPSVWPEPLGAVVIEAKAAGVPAIVFPEGGLPEWISPEVDGWICDEPSVASLLNAMRKVVRSPEILADMGPAALASAAHISDDFNSRWLAVYDSL